MLRAIRAIVASILREVRLEPAVRGVGSKGPGCEHVVFQRALGLGVGRRLGSRRPKLCVVFAGRWVSYPCRAASRMYISSHWLAPFARIIVKRRLPVVWLVFLQRNTHFTKEGVVVMCAYPCCNHTRDTALEFLLVGSLALWSPKTGNVIHKFDGKTEHTFHKAGLSCSAWHPAGGVRIVSRPQLAE